MKRYYPGSPITDANGRVIPARIKFLKHADRCMTCWRAEHPPSSAIYRACTVGETILGIYAPDEAPF
jgi:hypothetical protein